MRLGRPSTLPIDSDEKTDDNGASAGGQAIGRAACYRCHKPQLTCICDQVVRIHNRTNVWLVQHPRERNHPIGTARIAELSLANYRQDILYANLSRDVPPCVIPPNTALLYPGPTATVLSVDQPALHPDCLVVVDGTWANARTTVRDTPWLCSLPRVTIDAPKSRYRIRREPRDDYVSTIEALVAALKIIEPETANLVSMLNTFETMIDSQMALATARRTGKRPRRTRANRGGVHALGRHFDDVVALGLERPPRDTEGPPIMHLVAMRPDGGVFDELVRPAVMPTPRHLEHLELSEADLRRAIAWPLLAERWRAFLRPTDRVVAWSQGHLRLVTESLGVALPHATQLKSLYCSYTPGKIESVVGLAADLGATLSGVATSALPSGRAGKTASATLKVLDLLRHQAALR